MRLIKSPDVATLVAAVASKHNGIESANAILDSIPSDSEDGNIVRSLYALNATPNEAMHLAQLLCYGDNQKYIIGLYERSFGDLSFLRLFEILEENREKAKSAADVYQKWLYSLLNEMLEMETESDDADNIYLLLISQSKPLMEALKSNDDFCSNFETKYWTDYSNILNSIPANDEFKVEKYLSYISNDELWDFLIAYPDNGVNLIQIYGNFAPSFLMNQEFLDNPVAKQRIVTLMLNANDEQKQAFLHIPEDALLLYAQFLEKRQKLDDSYLMTATIILANEESHTGSSAKQKLEDWERIPSDETLKKEEGFAEDTVTLVSWLPGYDVGVVFLKSFDGRKVQTSDLISAGIDVAFLIPDVIGWLTAPATGGGSTVSIEAAKGALKGTVKLGAKTVAKETIKQTAKETMKEASKPMLKSIMLAGVKAMRQVARHVEKFTKIDITETVQTVFEKCLLKNDTFKKLTGLDARIFMRSDRRVYFNFGKAIEKIVGSNFTKSISDDVFWGASTHVVLSNPKVQNSIETIKEKIKKINNEKSEEEQWKSDLSAWWMMNQYDEITTDDKPSDKTAQATQQTE